MKKAIAILLALATMFSLCACGKSDEAKHADETIAAIGTVTLNSLGQIERAEKEVENLSDKDVKALDNLTTLYDARAEYNRLMAEDVEITIDAIGELNFDSKYLVENARSRYDELDDEIKALVANYDVLEQYEKDITKVRADAVMDAIQAANELPLETSEDVKTVYDAINNIDKMLDQLNDDEMALVTNIDIRDKKANEAGLLLAKNTIGDLEIECKLEYRHLNLNIFFKNTSEKTIKYIKWGVRFKNTVGDYMPVYGYDFAECEETGPYEPGKVKQNNGLVWKFYSSALNIYDVAEAEIMQIEIEYMDGSKVSLNQPDAIKSVMK